MFKFFFLSLPLRSQRAAQTQYEIIQLSLGLISELTIGHNGLAKLAELLLFCQIFVPHQVAVRFQVVLDLNHAYEAQDVD